MKKKRKASTKMTSRAAATMATNTKETVKNRIAALSQSSVDLCEKKESLQAVLKVLLNKEEPLELRCAALQTLQAASFMVASFQSCRRDYIAALRKLAVDPEPELRQRALGTLAREKDGFAQKKLIEGLQTPEKALVPPEKALQLLGYDPHADAYPIARAIVNNPPNPSAKREALRLLAADATAAPIFEKILMDKQETADARQISAAALQATRPDTLQAHARAILLDPSDYDEIKATSLTALTNFGKGEDVSRDDTLVKQVERLSNEASDTVKDTAHQFLNKYRR